MTDHRLDGLPKLSEPLKSWHNAGPNSSESSSAPDPNPSRRSFSAPGRFRRQFLSRMSPAPITYDYQVVMNSHRPTRFTETQTTVVEDSTQLSTAKKPQKGRPAPPVRPTKKSLRLQQQRQQQQQLDDEASGTGKTVAVRYTEPRLLETREAARRGGVTEVRRYRFTESFLPVRVYIVPPPVEAPANPAPAGEDAADGKKRRKNPAAAVAAASKLRHRSTSREAGLGRR